MVRQVKEIRVNAPSEHEQITILFTDGSSEGFYTNKHGEMCILDTEIPVDITIDMLMPCKIRD